jgi:hypothetical protein
VAQLEKVVWGALLLPALGRPRLQASGLGGIEELLAQAAELLVRGVDVESTGFVAMTCGDHGGGPVCGH